MGASTLGYIVVGPDVFSAETCQQAEQALHRIGAGAARDLKRLQQEERLREGLEEKYELFFQGDYETLEEFLNTLILTPEEITLLVNEFAEFWGDPTARDVCWRYHGDGIDLKKIVFAGGATGGDTPDGDGYALLDKIIRQFNILEIFGCS